MKIKTRSARFLLPGILFLSAGSVVAQPAEDGGRAVNPPNWPRMDNMTPAQRQEAMKQMVTRTMTESMKAIGITDQKTQTLILQFTEAQEKTKQAVRQKAGKVGLALMDKTQTEEQVAVLLKELRLAVEDAKATRKADIATLEELAELSKKPKLQAVLTMMGLIGDESLFTQGVMVNFFNAMGMIGETPPAPEAPAG